MTDKKPETNIKWETIVIPKGDETKCNHYFEFIDGECRCRNCHMGLLGVINVVDGKPQ